MESGSLNMSALLSDLHGREGGGEGMRLLFVLPDLPQGWTPLDLKGGMGFLGKPISAGLLGIFAGAGAIHRGAQQKFQAAVQRMAEDFAKMNNEGHQLLVQMASLATVDGAHITGLPPELAFKMHHGQEIG
jgi:hypothetical protein